ncbi:hypothetical protein [Variovorax guangxiensis]|uniref:hypothetical protein n=1 Tax=Variovorax guangxiensis TaxID=1775474 RepID=UPI00285E5C54|nr:hypothetical protein [Variovorax guangxiensis]MDR6856586.1 DNA-binding response OmpR family regulator [Variovorax guangxiensis]
MSRILLVQERHDAALALLDELQRAGHVVEPVEDGAAALHRMLTSPPELTLLGTTCRRSTACASSRRRATAAISRSSC